MGGQIPIEKHYSSFEISPIPHTLQKKGVTKSTFDINFHSDLKIFGSVSPKSDLQVWNLIVITTEKLAVNSVAVNNFVNMYQQTHP